MDHQFLNDVVKTYSYIICNIELDCALLTTDTTFKYQGFYVEKSGGVLTEEEFIHFGLNENTSL